jgi:hypothetical protein
MLQNKLLGGDFVEEVLPADNPDNADFAEIFMQLSVPLIPAFLLLYFL